MKCTTLVVTILYSMAGPASLLAEEAPGTVKPIAAEVMPVDVESAARQAVAEKLLETEAPATELTRQQSEAETLSEPAAPAAGLDEPLAMPEAPAEAAAPVTGLAEEEVVPETSLEVVGAGADASGTDTPKAPCPRPGMGKMRKGMGYDDKGPGNRKPGCDHRGGMHQNKHEQVVRRLDMIEARMAKIEAMLERLMQR